MADFLMGVVFFGVVMIPVLPCLISYPPMRPIPRAITDDERTWLTAHTKANRR